MGLLMLRLMTVSVRSPELHRQLNANYILINPFADANLRFSEHKLYTL